MFRFWFHFGDNLGEVWRTKLSPKSIKKHCREAPQKQDPKKYQFWKLWGVQKCTKSVPGMVEMMTWAPFGVSGCPQAYQRALGWIPEVNFHLFSSVREARWWEGRRPSLERNWIIVWDSLQVKQEVASWSEPWASHRSYAIAPQRLKLLR